VPATGGRHLSRRRVAVGDRVGANRGQTGLRVTTWGEVESLVANRIPESPSLEYKSALELGVRSEKVEALKDLTGIGNGGGGTLIYGVEEDAANDGIPIGLERLTDRGLVGILEDIARSSVSPPLLMELRILEGPGGFLLVVEIMRSPLAPYMVEAYGERRYYIRIGTRTAPMTEQQIRDAYMLAARARERRGDLWEEHSLPFRPPTGEPWLAISALPEEPLRDLLDPTSIQLDSIRHPHWMNALANEGRFDDALLGSRLQIWADGLHGDDRTQTKHPTSIFRLHRDGAATLATSHQHQPLPLYSIARELNAQIVYLTWLWQEFGLQTAVEVHAALEHLNTGTLVMGSGDDVRPPHQPSGTAVTSVSLHREFLPWDLRRASRRHEFVRDFSDRLVQSFGHSSVQVMFRVGWLYGPDGIPLRLGLGGAGVWSEAGDRVAIVHNSGRIGRLDAADQTVGFVRDGVVLDKEGGAMATLEMATGAALPDTFIPKAFAIDARYRAAGGSGEPLADENPVELPVPRGEWSDSSLALVINPRPS